MCQKYKIALIALLLINSYAWCDFYCADNKGLNISIVAREETASRQVYYNGKLAKYGRLICWSVNSSIEYEIRPYLFCISGGSKENGFMATYRFNKGPERIIDVSLDIIAKGKLKQSLLLSCHKN